MGPGEPVLRAWSLLKSEGFWVEAAARLRNPLASARRLLQVSPQFQAGPSLSTVGCGTEMFFEKCPHGEETAKYRKGYPFPGESGSASKEHREHPGRLRFSQQLVSNCRHRGAGQGFSIPISGDSLRVLQASKRFLGQFPVLQIRAIIYLANHENPDIVGA